ncbi:MAG: response regulator [Bacteroidetes bacterium]|nr:response regulator [Bacteroidota bacterium]
MKDGARIMIVDDSLVVGERLQRLLLSVREIAAIEFEPSLQLAASRLVNFPPDILILDHHFHDGSGEDLLRTQRAQLENTHVIVYSAFGSLLNHARYRALGAKVIFDKSESPETLIAVVESIIRVRLKQWKATEVQI